MSKTISDIVVQALPNMINSAHNVLMLKRRSHSSVTSTELASEIMRNALQYLVQLLEENYQELYGYQLEHGTAYTVLHNYGARGGALDIMVRDAIRIAYESGKADGKRES